MKVLFKYLRLLSLSTSGALLLCIVFAANPEIAEGTITGKIFWFHFSILLLAFSVLFMETTVKKSNFTFSLPDGLLLLFIGLTLFNYDRELNPQPERLLFAGQLGTLWFMLRAILQNHSELRLFFMSILICTGIFEAMWGMEHLYGSDSTAHPLLKADGLIFNPTPFSGYLAIILPVCLNLALRFRDCDKMAWWEFRTMVFYLAVFAIGVILIALPGGASRPAWLAAGASCCWVFFLRKSGWALLKKRVIRHNKTVILGGVILFLVISFLPTLGGIFHPDQSANRMLMWNVTTKAILNQPLTGTGLGGFPALFAQTQAEYFTSGKASETELTAAGCPKFAYNDYLQLGLELGVIGLLLFALWIGFCLYYGLKNKQVGSTGGMLALLLFSMYSYPLQLPSFWVLLIFFSAMCVTRPEQAEKSSPKNCPHIGTFAALVACTLFFGQRGYYEPYKEWKIVRALGQKDEQKIAAQGYLCLYPRLSHQVAFLQEGSRCFMRCGQYSDAIVWSRRAIRLSADPEFYYILAESHQQLGLYKQAEKYLLKCLHILPEQIETYYRLTKLYAETDYYHPEKLRLAAHSVLTKKPAVNSDTIKRMKEEAYQLLQMQSF